MADAMKLVPVEPTEAMLAAVRPINGRKVWSAMLAASPPAREEAPAEGAGEREDRLRVLEVLTAESNAPHLAGITHSDPTISCTSASRLTTAILSALRNRTSEPEAGAVAWRKQVWVASGIGTGWMLSNQKPEPNHQPTEIEPLFTHPAPATADKMRVAIPEGLYDALTDAWTDFLDANPDDLTSPTDLPDHALVTCDQMIDMVREAFAALNEQPQ